MFKKTFFPDSSSQEKPPKFDPRILRYIFVSLAFLVLFAFALANFGVVVSVLKKILSVFSPLLIGGCIAYLINMLMRPLEQGWGKLFAKKNSRLSGKLKRPVCMILSILIVLGVVFAVVFLVIPGFRGSVQTLTDSLPTYTEKVTGWWNQLVGLAARWNISLEALELDSDAILKRITDFFSDKGGNLLSATWNATTSILGGVINGFLAFIFSLYMLAKKETVCFHLKRLLQLVVPEKRAPRFFEILNMTDRAFTSFISGQVVEAVIIGVLCCIGMLLFRMPYAGVVSVVIGFSAIIPIIGAWFGGSVGFLLVLLAEPAKAIWFVVFLVTLQQLEDNLIYPKVVGKSVGLPGLLVLISVTLGGSAFGFIGMLFGVPVCSVLYSLYQQYFSKKDAKAEPETHGTEEVTQ